LLVRLASEANVEPALRCFELELLAELGYGLGLHEAQFEPTSYYRYDGETGLLPSMEQTHYRGDVLNAIANNDYQERLTRQVAKRLTRQALQPLLGNKVLRTKELFYGKADLPRS
jgi:DNA repair protein RecO (recombination protein O)